MWESESEARGRERMSSLEIERHDGMKNDAFVRRDQSWYILLIYILFHVKIFLKRRPRMS
jgi:hypothetical protein